MAQWANQTGPPANQGGLPSGAMAAIGSTGTALINGIFGLAETSSQNKTNKQIASAQFQTQEQIANMNNVSNQAVASGQEATQFILASDKLFAPQTPIQAQNNTPALGGVSVSFNDGGSMIAIGMFLSVCVIGVFIFVLKK